MNRTVFIMLKPLVLEHSELQLLEHSHTYVVECLAKLSEITQDCPYLSLPQNLKH